MTEEQQKKINKLWFSGKYVINEIAAITGAHPDTVYNHCEKKTKNMKIGIYHRADLDGLACAAIMKLRFPGIELVGWDYGDDPGDFFSTYDIRGYEVYMADVSMPLEAMKRIADEADTFTWIDHHEKALAEIRPEMPDNTFVVYIPGWAACESAWGWFFPDEKQPEVITSLGAYDVWRKDDPARSWHRWILPIQMHYNAYFENAIEFIFDDIKPGNRDDNMIILDALNEGRGMMQFESAQIRRAMLNGKTREYNYAISDKFRSYLLFTVNATGNPGRLADEVFYQYPEVEIVVQYYRLFNGQWKYSLRSQDDGPNVAEIAGRHGGGGHPNAAGFVSDELIF